MTPGRPFTEYRAIGISEPLRQGDVLERTDPDSTPWNRHLLVITADCDFAHEKHQGRVTCVPLLPKDEYLHELQIPKLRQQVALKLMRCLREALSATGRSAISDTRLRAWPSEQSTDGILRAIDVSSDAAEPLRGLLDGLRLADAPTHTLADAAKNLVEAQLKLPNAKSEKNLIAELTVRLQNVFKQPPGDALFISCLADGLDTGYFVYLRHLEQIWESQIALGPSHASVDYRRLSRLQETFTHALAQRFALVFMSIGLPSEYEEIRDLHAELLGEGL